MTKLSHSAVSKYLTCPEMYRLHYNERLRTSGISSALIFGKAIDKAIEAMLTGGDYKQVFYETWTRQEINGALEYLDKNENISYFKSDLDEALIIYADTILLNSMAPSGVVSVSQARDMLNQAPFKRVPSGVLLFYNYACWLSLKAKGILMLEAYERDIKPRIKKVIAMQKPISLENTEGDSAIGYIDLIAELDTGEIVVIDNKTAGRPYEEDCVPIAAQLALYSYAIADEIPHTKCGYAVMIKKIAKDYKKVCTVCGVQNTGSHKTCAEKEGGKRCGGEFSLEPMFVAQTQFILDEIPQRTKDIVVDNFNMINRAIKAEIFPKNLDTCKDVFGSECPFFSKCHLGSEEGLHKEVQKKEENFVERDIIL